MKSIIILLLFLSCTNLLSEEVGEEYIPHEWEWDNGAYNSILKEIDDKFSKDSLFHIKIISTDTYLKFFDSTHRITNRLYDFYCKVEMSDTVKILKYITFLHDESMYYCNGKVTYSKKKSNQSYVTIILSKEVHFNNTLNLLTGIDKFFPLYAQATPENYALYMQRDTVPVFERISPQTISISAGRFEEYKKSYINETQKTFGYLDYLKYLPISMFDVYNGMNGDLISCMPKYFFQYQIAKDNSYLSDRTQTLISHEMGNFNFDSIVAKHFDKVSEDDLELDSEVENLLKKINRRKSVNKLYLFSTINCLPCDNIANMLKQNHKELKELDVDLVIFKPYTDDPNEKDERYFDNVELVYMPESEIEKYKIHYAPLLIYYKQGSGLKVFNSLVAPNKENVFDFLSD